MTASASSLPPFPKVQTPQNLLLVVGFFYLMHRVLSVVIVPYIRIPASPKRSRTLLQLPLYILSTIHAVVSCYRGIRHLRILFRASIPLKLAAPPFFDASNRYHVEIYAVTCTNLLFSAYVVHDLLHVILQFPDLGSWDTLLHHVIFSVCAVVAGHYKLQPFAFSWLIIGEVSTPLLNARWFLINTQRTTGWTFAVVERLFALAFFLSRMVLYSIGLAYHLESLQQLPQHVPVWAAAVSTATMLLGAVLNVVWMVKIMKLGSKRTAAQQQQQQQQQQESARGRTKES